MTKRLIFLGMAAVALSLIFTGCPIPNDPDPGPHPATEATVVNAGLDLTVLVTAPVKDAAPVTTFTAQTQYTGAIVWQTSAGAAVTGDFAAGTVYKAVLTLAAKSGYTFTGIGANRFTYTGAT
jgi:hypothetical protein